MNNEKLIFLYALNNNKFKNVKSVFFMENYLGTLYTVSKDYFEEHGDLPKQFYKTLYHILRSNTDYLKLLGINDVLQDSIDEQLQQIISSIFNEDLTTYDEEFLKKGFETWLKIKSFEYRYQSMASYIGSVDITDNNVDNVITKASDIFNNVELNIDDDNDGIDFLNPEHHDFSTVSRISTGKTFVDKLLGGGLEPKTLTLYLGQQGKGKSLWMCADAAYFMKAGYNVVYITCETSARSFTKRVGSMVFNIPIAKYEEYAKQPNYIAQQINNLRLNSITHKLGKLHIKQMASPTTKDVANYVKKKEQEWNEKCHVVIVDYLKIMSNWRNTAGNSWQDHEVKAKDLRDEGMRNNWLIFTAMQIKKEAWDSSDYEIDAIAESAAITYHADLILGIIQDPLMTEENVYWLKILKMRDGDGIGKKCKFQKHPLTLKITETKDVIMGTGI